MNNFVKKKQSFVCFRLWAKNPGKLPIKLLTAFSKLKNTYPGDQILSHILMFDDPFCQFPTFLAEVFWKVCRNGFLWALRIVLKEKNLSNKEVFCWRFSDLEQQILKFRQTKSAGMPKFWSISSKEHFEVNNVVQKKSSFVFFKFWAINAGTLPEKNWLPSPECILKVQGIIFHHISWCSMTYFVSFPLLLEIFWRKNRNGLLWVLRIVSKEKKSFEQRSVLWKNFGRRAIKV